MEHCIVPGGGLSKLGKWKTAKSKGKYLFPVKAMSLVFRAKYVESIKAKMSHPDPQLIADLFKKKWVVFAKRPFGNPQSVIEYLALYPQNSHQQSSDKGYRSKLSHLQLQRLSQRRPKEPDETGCTGVYPPVFDAHFTQRVCPHSSLRNIEQYM